MQFETSQKTRPRIFGNLEQSWRCITLEGKAKFLIFFVICVLSITTPKPIADAADLTQILTVVRILRNDFNNQSHTITTFIDDFFPRAIEIANLAADGVAPDPTKKKAQLGTVGAFLDGLEVVVYERKKDLNSLGKPNLIPVSADEFSNAFRRCESVKTLKENERELELQVSQCPVFFK